ncbi:DUF3592 domain-containing protein [Streptomyces sp. NPDC006641]|uniref:DUF3592 domain-containing protein n=1 Tax=unclassified Streptomyces TaxID=2593676 RepID=UPI002E77CD7B|nr:DUF3592 domain-containing protein [Streptomyces sp. JV184]MEE1743773.1 hypothetical protein [Streptomyces sp. JV184]
MERGLGKRGVAQGGGWETVNTRRWLYRFGGWARVAGKVVGGVAVTTLAALFVVLGYGFVRTGLDGMSNASMGAARERSVDGTVVAGDEVSEPQGMHSKRIEIRFTTDAGMSYQFWEAGDADVGDTIRVRYEPGRPETATTHSVTSDRMGYGMLTLVGLALVILMPLLILRLGREGFRDIRRAVRKRPPVE